MRATCEVVVERETLLAALGVDSAPMTLRAPDEVEIGAGTAGVTLSTASLECELQAVGAWDRLVLTSRHLMEALLRRTSRPTVKLLFVGNELFVDRLPVPAEDLGLMAAFGARRPPRAAGQPRQCNLPLPELPATRLRSARAQLPARGLPLFS